MSNSTEVLDGHVSALSIVIAQIILSLPQQTAENAARRLGAEIEALRNMDNDHQTPPLEAQTRDALLVAYLDLLQTAASRERSLQ